MLKINSLCLHSSLLVLFLCLLHPPKELITSPFFSVSYYFSHFISLLHLSRAIISFPPFHSQKERERKLQKIKEILFFKPTTPGDHIERDYDNYVLFWGSMAIFHTTNLSFPPIFHIFKCNIFFLNGSFILLVSLSIFNFA